jgi:hypothetical protein
VPVEQMEPKICPLCGSKLITRILCDTLLSAQFRGMECPSEGVVAYHCEDSHVFLVLRNDFHWGQPVATDSMHAHTADKGSSLGSFFKDHVVRKTLSPAPFFLYLISTLLGRQEKFQTLGLAR